MYIYIPFFPLCLCVCMFVCLCVYVCTHVDKQKRQVKRRVDSSDEVLISEAPPTSWVGLVDGQLVQQMAESVVFGDHIVERFLQVHEHPRESQVA